MACDVLLFHRWSPSSILAVTVRPALEVGRSGIRCCLPGRGGHLSPKVGTSRHSGRQVAPCRGHAPTPKLRKELLRHYPH